MSIWQRAVETYDCHSDSVGKSFDNHVTLMPISHIIQNAQIEIILDEYGDFKEALDVAKDKKNNKTIIPATERSAGRVGDTPCAHPLSDQLRYIATYMPERHEPYLNQLRAWAESEFSHPKVRAILAYIERGTIVDDLADENIIELDESGKPLSKYDKYMIRWRVMNTGDNDACYKDTSLFDAFIGYYRSLQNEAPKKLCMISGKDERITESHPKGTVASSYGAKLISANDSSNFTYRGRFTDSQQAATIGYETSQKAHNALAWVAANQGIIIGGRTFVCWNPKGDTSLFKDSGTLTPNYSDEEEEKDFPVTPTDYKADLKKALSGWQDKLPAEDDIVIASFDAATTGRLSITYYNELKGSDFLNRLAFWKEHCYWSSGKFGYQSPSIWEIVKCAFGTEQNGKLSVDDRVMREQAQRLLHSVIDQAPIPQDIVRALMHRASMPLAYDTKSNRIKILYNACAVIYAYRTVTKKEEWEMALEKDKKDRSYQFGRLLAVMEKVERDTYDRDEKREPNAIRMQSVFCERPMYASRIIRDSLNPYFAKLSPGMRIYYNNLIGEIFERLSEFDEKDLNRQLEDSYLLGYYLQRSELYTKKESNNEEEN
mgnify:FL=1